MTVQPGSGVLPELDRNDELALRPCRRSWERRGSPDQVQSRTVDLR